MRKPDRDKIIELINTIQEAMEYCKNVSNEDANMLFSDCKTAVTSILHNINSKLPDSSKVQYYSLFNTLEEAIRFFNDGNTILMQIEFFDKVIICLSALKKKLLNEEIKYEIAFLPYNATMWDSLESIWFAAKENSKCECYVIPIPYYDKNYDGTLGKMHYDGDKFPDYIHITNYTEYNIEQRNPDIIYIHNPYDKFNKVTSVHPNYYSYNLKNYTNMLVYVPYFVSMDYLVEDFSILPGVRFADKVILQSEKFTKEYKKYYQGEDKDKFLPLGSPKIDNVIKMSKLGLDEFNIPESWKQLIGDKKVILYNTHLNNIINHGELVLKKLRYVFSVFENRNDVVLLWRPHPFSISTAVAMNPNVLQSYKQIVEEYKCKGFGIFDDTPDLHRAIALADAYFGDRSSLVGMFGVVGKPIMIQDLNFDRRISVSEHRALSFEDAYIDGDDLWFSASNFNGLFCMNLKTGKVNHLGSFPKENLATNRLHSRIIRYNNKLLFVPLNALNIDIFDMDEQKFSQVELLRDKHGLLKFFACSRVEDCIYLFPFFYPGIVKFDIKSEKIEYLDNLYKSIKGDLSTEFGNFFKIINIGNVLYLPHIMSNRIYKYDVINNRIAYETVEECVNPLIGIEKIDDRTFFIPKSKNKILCKSNLEWITYNIADGISEESIEPYFTNYVIIGNNIFMIALNTPEIFRINIESKECTRINLEEFDLNKKNPYRDYLPVFSGYAYDSKNNKLYILPSKLTSLICIDVLNGDKSEVQVNLPDEWDFEYMARYVYYDNEDNMIEGPYLSLKTFLDTQLSEDKKYNQKLISLFNNIGDCGLKINSHIINLLDK